MRALSSEDVPSWRDAVQEVAGGVRLLVEASPGARSERFPDGFDPWRGRIGVRVREPAQDGRANGAIVRAVAAFFGVAAAQVTLESGAAAGRKSLLVRGVGARQAQERLAPLLEAP